MLTLAGLGVILLSAVAFSPSGGVRSDQAGSTSEHSTQPASGRAEPRTCLTISDLKPLVDDNSITLAGTMTNGCGRSFRYVQVTYKLLDESGAIVGSALANLAGLDVGQSWKFQAFGMLPHTVKSYRLDQITAY